MIRNEDYEQITLRLDGQIISQYRKKDIINKPCDWEDSGSGSL